MSDNIQSVRGMNDCLPDVTDTWQAFEAIVRDWLRRYGYREMRTPILEHTGLFKRAIGEVTDIRRKGDVHLYRRVERRIVGAAPGRHGVLGARVIQHNLLYDGGKRLWYTGRCSATNGRKRAATGSFTRLASRRLGLPGRTSMRN